MRSEYEGEEQKRKIPYESRDRSLKALKRDLEQIDTNMQGNISPKKEFALRI